MTPTATLESQLQGALQTLSAGLPNARIFVVSIPNVYHLWEILHTSFYAVVTWTLGDICQSLLAHPTSDCSRRRCSRQQVYDRNVADNLALSPICARFIHCRYDGNAAFNLQFVRATFRRATTSIQPLRARPRRQQRPGQPPPIYDQMNLSSNAQTVADPGGGTDVTLSATDNAGVSGIEYTSNGGVYQSYTGTFAVPAGTTITYRAVDVNGNVEQTHTLTG